MGDLLLIVFFCSPICLPPANEAQLNNVPQQIHFKQFQYKVFKGPKTTEPYVMRPAYASQRKNFNNRREDYSNVSNIPYPSSEMSLKALNLENKIQKRTITVYEQALKKLESAKVQLKELSKQREKLLHILQKSPTLAVPSPVEKMVLTSPICCCSSDRRNLKEDLPLIINTATVVIQTTTMEINLVETAKTLFELQAS